MCLDKINLSTFGTMRRIAITVNYLQNAVSSGGVFLLSLKSCFSHWGTAFFEEITLLAGVLLSSKSLLCLLGCLLVFFLRRVALHAVLSSSKVCFTCGVAWLVGLLGLLRGGLLSLAFLSFYK